MPQQPDGLASLDLLKAERVIPDTEAAEHNMSRVRDNRGEDHLFSASNYVPVPLDDAVE